jgi:hypothetical protein
MNKLADRIRGRLEEVREVWNPEDVELLRGALALVDAQEELPLGFKFDTTTDTVELCGVKYSAEVFRAFGYWPEGSWLRIMKRADGRVEVFQAPEGARVVWTDAAGKQVTVDANLHARTYPRDPKAPPHWLRCNHVTAESQRCIKGEGHAGEHEYPKPKT